MTSLATTNDKAEMGHRLAQVRAQMGLSQAEFAASLGVSLNAYVNYERGTREVPSVAVRAVRRVYGIDTEWLLDGPEVEPQTAAGRVFDLDLYELIVVALETHFEVADRRPSPRQYAAAARLLYALAQNGPRPTKARLSEIVRAAVVVNGRKR
jgi:transcriptional regulator with XRE-family HTH domain